MRAGSGATVAGPDPRPERLVPVHWVEDGGALLRTGVLLSPREIGVLAALGHGCANREIAERLYLAESTVRTNVSHLQQRLGMNRIQLAILWDRIARTSPLPLPDDPPAAETPPGPAHGARTRRPGGPTPDPERCA